MFLENTIWLGGGKEKIVGFYFEKGMNYLYKGLRKQMLKINWLHLITRANLVTGERFMSRLSFSICVTSFILKIPEIKPQWQK